MLIFIIAIVLGIILFKLGVLSVLVTLLSAAFKGALLVIGAFILCNCAVMNSKINFALHSPTSEFCQGERGRAMARAACNTT
jgi:hypothetical protein